MDIRKDNKQNNKEMKDSKKNLSLSDVTNGESLFASSEEMEKGIEGIMGIHNS